MREAIDEYGAGEFTVPPGGQFYPIDRQSGQRLEAGAQGPGVVYEYFRQGEEPFFGMLSVVDGGFGMGSNLPMFAVGLEDGANGDIVDGDSVGRDGGGTVETSTGGNARVPVGTGFGELTSGGLY